MQPALFLTVSVVCVTLACAELKIVSKAEWKAEAAKAEPTKLSLPVIKVIIIHTATDSCTSRESCEQKCRDIQAFHLHRRDFDEIAYNFLVGGDGLVYEGRGWDLQGAHTKGQNSQSIGIALIGAFNKAAPSGEALDATQKLIEEGVKLGKLDANYKVHSHRHFSHSESPGDKLIEIIKKWPHYSDA